MYCGSIMDLNVLTAESDTSVCLTKISYRNFKQRGINFAVGIPFNSFKSFLGMLVLET